ncbi:MAG: hypothetical protein AMXMBFR4_06710 [Candidatus Hydrogenedentota bacterium]
MERELTTAEYRAVESHRIRLCQERGVDVGFESALEDWRLHFAVRWREQRQARLLAAQRAEIERHKWIESEKAGHDLGREAVLDWIQKNAAAWRAWYDSHDNECGDAELQG